MTAVAPAIDAPAVPAAMPGLSTTAVTRFTLVMLQRASLGAAYKYAGTFTGDELQVLAAPVLSLLRAFGPGVLTALLTLPLSRRSSCGCWRRRWT